MVRIMLRSLLVASVVALLMTACDGDGDGSPEPIAEPSDGAIASFTSGVASGDVTSNSAVLWTRADGGDRLDVELTTDAAFGTLVTRTAVETSADRDFTVKHRADGLTPATRYHYRFRAGDALSPAGTFVTAPEPGSMNPLRFVFSGDSDGSRRPDGAPPYNEFEVLDAAAAEEPVFFLYFGDTIYADREPRATTLDGYRAKYRENRGYRALTDILAATSTYNTWDDHEVVNDFAGTTVDPTMLEAGLRAFREYMPIDDAGGAGDDATLYRSFRWGAAVELIVLDERTYRSDSAAATCTAGENPDPIPGVAAPGAPPDVRALRAFVGLPDMLPPRCMDEIDSASRTMLGNEQKGYLKERLTTSDATWKVIVNQVPIQALLALPYDRWEGYAAERREILEYIRDESIKNVIFLTTDFHANIFGPVRIDPFDGAPPVAYEAVAGPIATAPLQQDVVDVLGEGGAGLLQPFFVGIVKVDCAELNSYAYGLVEIDPAAGTMTITAKDETGKVLCRTELKAES
jgi:phosphodiesterase/alkaline phosphatase D-like protein